MKESSSSKKKRGNKFEGLSRRDAFAKVTSARQATEFLLLYGKRKWRSHEIQDALRSQFRHVISESTVTRYCRFFCHPALAPQEGRAFTYIHKTRSIK